MTRPIRRRDFLALSATVGAGTAISALAASPAARAGTLPADDVIAAAVGILTPDPSPLASAFPSFGGHGRAALDYDYRSFGADLGTAQQVNAIELVPESRASRLNSRDLTVYASDDNATWTRLGSQMVTLDDGSIWLYGFDTHTRYIKVHSHRGELTGSTLILDRPDADLRVHRLGPGQFVGSGGGTWHYKTPIQVRNPTRARLRARAAYIPLSALGADRLTAAGQLAGDLRDLRFADAADQELHAYTDGTGVFVRIPDIAPGAILPVVAYTGNPSAINRVTQDEDTLQVQYGNITLADTDSFRALRLPDGTMMLVTATGLRARYSRDGGRTWSAPEQMIPGVTSGGPSGGLVDPETGVLTFVYYVSTVSAGADWTDPAQHNCQTYVARAASYTSDGRPVFGSPQHIPVRSHAGNLAAWALNYTNPIRTRSGAYLLPVSYIITPDGTFALNVVRSTDGGQTWVQSPSQLTLPETAPPALGGWVDYLESGISENGLAQLNDGRILLLARQESPYKNRFAVSQSFDDGITWTPVADSTILASNTQPELLSGQGKGLVLSFPGHNVFSQESYWRNNLTSAYSDDNGRTWNGYHDLLGATTLSTPGWAGFEESRRVVNASSAPSGTADRLFVWVDWNSPDVTMLVEDFDSYLRDSHGALDVIRYSDTAGAANGTELAQSRWWRSLRAGTLNLVPGARPGRQAVHLTTTGYETAASRLFPAVRRGTVRFALRWNSLASGLRISLQEAYSDNSVTAGTVLSLRLTPAGDLLAASQDPAKSGFPLIGHCTPDTSPATGNLSSINYKAPSRPFDYMNCSIGADLLKPTKVTGLELVDGDEALTHDGTRLRPEDLQVWVSDTNDGDWQPVSGWSGVMGGHTITLTGPPVTTRYIKVHQPYSDTTYTFSNDQQRLLRVLPDHEANFPYRPLRPPTRLGDGEWHLVQLDVDLPARRTTVTVDGVSQGWLPQLSAADVVTHLLVYLEENPGQSEIALDEFIVQDTSLGLPAIAHVGPTTPEVRK